MNQQQQQQNQNNTNQNQANSQQTQNSNQNQQQQGTTIFTIPGTNNTIQIPNFAGKFLLLSIGAWSCLVYTPSI